MSRKANQRELNGVLLLDKPTGISSNGALQRAKWLLRAKKAGHTGSLDPIASGLLPLCVGEATKLSGFLLNTDKRYRVTVRLGVVTETGDTEGAVLETNPVPALTQSLVEDALAGFRGDILQVPPMYSALKHQGQRLYDLARQGVEVEREPRQISIYELRVIAMDADSLELDVHCSKGTYIRTLAEDLGRVLGCGGHVENLRRTRVGYLDVNEAHTLERLEALSDEDRPSLLLPMDSIVADFPAVRLNDQLSFYVRKGEAVLVPKAPTEGWVRLYRGESSFMGMGEVLDDGRIAPRRLVKAAPRESARKTEAGQAPAA